MLLLEQWRKICLPCLPACLLTSACHPPQPSRLQATIFAKYGEQVTEVEKELR